jgi:hypothetical protein
MSQHDLNIANQGFPAFRADLNDALVALGSTNSGATAPATTYANQLWYDTANNILKIRNEDNDAWISLLTLNQTADTVSEIATAIATLGAGSASNPSLTTAGDANTGIFFPAADTIAFAEGGVEVMRIDSSGNVGIGISSPAYRLDISSSQPARGVIGYLTNSFSATKTGAQLGFSQAGLDNWAIGMPSGATSGFAIWNGRAASSDGSEYLRITSAGNLGIGTTNPTVKLNAVGTSSTALTLARFSNASTASVTTKTAGMAFCVADTEGTVKDVAILTGYPNGFNAEQGGLAFSTRGAGEAISERMRIDSAGNVFVGATTNGVTDYTIGRSIVQNNNYANAVAYAINSTESVGTQYYLAFGRAGSTCGAISSSTTNSTTYATSSDYRLKENIEPMTGALDKVTALKPVTYKWKSDGSESQGFIAHELAEVFPDAVVGEKDGVQIINELDDEGKVIGTKEVPRYQGVDTSFLVATLAAAIQELKTELDSVKAELSTLKGAE